MIRFQSALLGGRVGKDCSGMRRWRPQSCGFWGSEPKHAPNGVVKVTLKDLVEADI